MDKLAVQDKGDCWICFNNENNITLTTVDSERTLKSCHTYLDNSIIIKRFDQENQVSCCSCCFESTRQLISLEEKVEKLQKEISDVSSGFSKNVLKRRSRLQTEIKNSSNSVLPSENCFKSPNYFDRPSFEMIENVAVKKEIIETISKQLPADSHGNSKRNNCIFSDPWFEFYKNDNVNYEKCETAVYSEDAIEVKYSYDEIESREVDNPDKELVTHQGLSETNAEGNEQAKTTSTADLAKCFKTSNTQLKGVPFGKCRNSRKIVAGRVQKNSKCETKAFDDSSEPINRSETLFEERPVKCREIACSKLFRGLHDLKDHERTHSGEKPYKCSVCEKSFKKSDALKRHGRIHSGERPYKCSFCECTFRQSGDAKRHEMIHTGERPYKCSFCSKSFHRSFAAKEHEMIHTGERPHKCSICEMTFIQRSNLKGHYARMHGDEENNEKLP